MFGGYSLENIVEQIQSCFHPWGAPFPGLRLGWWLEAAARKVVDVGPWTVFPILSPFLKRIPPNVEKCFAWRESFIFPPHPSAWVKYKT